MPQLTQIARSAVLRMQIRFAWKSIWGCLKESRTALLLSPLTDSRGGSFSPSISSRVENIFTSSARMATHLHGDALQSKAPWANMQISEACTDGPVCKRHEEPCNGVLTQTTHAIQAHRGNNHPLCRVSQPLTLQQL